MIEDDKGEMLEAPTDIVLQQVNISTIRVEWAPINNAIKYRIFVGLNPEFNNATALSSETIEAISTSENSPSTKQTTTIMNLVTGRKYYIRVEAINSCSSAGKSSSEHSLFLDYPERFKIVNRYNKEIIIPNYIHSSPQQEHGIDKYEYDIVTGSICLKNASVNSRCIKIINPTWEKHHTPIIVLVPFDGDDDMTWDITSI
jgi:hypothetical protein